MNKGKKRNIRAWKLIILIINKEKKWNFEVNKQKLRKRNIINSIKVLWFTWIR